MIYSSRSSTVAAPCLLLLAFAAYGCENHYLAAPAKPQEKTRPEAEPAKSSQPPIERKKAELGKGVWLETEGQRRRVLVAATVCLREGSFGLECLLCRSRTKEHESILATDSDARLIHFGLVATGAKPGAPVEYKEQNGQYITVPPSGSRIKVSLRYEDGGKSWTVPAQAWIRNGKTKKELTDDWVFAGSRFWDNPDDPKKPIYAAGADGALICTSNVATAMLDLPIRSPKQPEERSFEPFTEHIPELGTKVTIVLEPEQEKTKK